jgi:hypothetical protein
MRDAFASLERFVRHEMGMSHIYQPVMLLELMRSGGTQLIDQTVRSTTCKGFSR